MGVGREREGVAPNTKEDALAADQALCGQLPGDICPAAVDATPPVGF